METAYASVDDPRLFNAYGVVMLSNEMIGAFPRRQHPRYPAHRILCVGIVDYRHHIICRRSLGTHESTDRNVQAQASGAKAIGLANGGSDTVNCIKQAAEFGITKKQKVAGLLFLIHDVHGVGLQQAQGVLLNEAFYWNLNAGTREFAKRYAARFNGVVPGAGHAGQYSCVMHYLKAAVALGPDKAQASGRAAVDQMKAMPVNDPLFKGKVRVDGRMVHDMYLFEVKSPAQVEGALGLLHVAPDDPCRPGVPSAGSGWVSVSA